MLFRGWGKTGPAHSFPTLTSVSINLVQARLSGWRKTGPALTQLVKVSMTLSYANNLCFLGGGEKLGRPSLSPPLTSESINFVQKHVYSWRVRLAVFFRRRLTICTTVFPHPITFWTRLMFNLVRVGKEWAGPVFPHPLTSNFMFYAYSGQGNLRLAEFFPTPLIHMHNSFSPRDNLVHKVDV